MKVKSIFFNSVFSKTLWMGIIAVALISPSVFSEEGDEMLVPSENKELVEEAPQADPGQLLYDKNFRRDMNALVQSLIALNHNRSLALIEKLSEKVKSQQEEVLFGFFPDTVVDFKKVRSQGDLTQSDFGGSSYGVLYTLRYVNEGGNTIEINIVHADESIRDYQELIQNPNLIHKMDNTSVVTIGGYRALETVSEDKSHYEQNIVFDEDLMMTLVAIGIDDADPLNRIITGVDIELLQAYLRN